jgi:hypothetical protein
MNEKQELAVLNAVVRLTTVGEDLHYILITGAVGDHPRVQTNWPTVENVLNTLDHCRSWIACHPDGETKQ